MKRLGLKATEKKVIAEEGDSEINPGNDSGHSHSDCAEESVTEVNSPRASKGRAGGIGVGEKCDALEVLVVVGGDENKCKVPMKNNYVAIILLCRWCICVILFQVRCCDPKLCENGETFWVVKGLSQFE